MSNVNVIIGNWRATGINVSTPQYKVDITINWIDEAGVEKESVQTVTFPNDLALVPASWVKNELQDLMLRAIRKKLNIDKEVAL